MHAQSELLAVTAIGIGLLAVIPMTSLSVDSSRLRAASATSDSKRSPVGHAEPPRKTAIRQVRTATAQVGALVDVGGGTVAGTGPGAVVYRNEIAAAPGYYPPGPMRCQGGSRNGTPCTTGDECLSGGTCVPQRLADDIELVAGSCNMVYYSIAVYGDTGGPCPGEGTYDVRTELWTGDPCVTGSTLIPATVMDFRGLRNCESHLLEADLADAPVSIPARVWLAVLFSSADAGWIVAERAEIGSTADYFSEDERDATPTTAQCGLYSFRGNPYAGFWANIHCDTTTPPNGSCCLPDGTCADTVAMECDAQGGSFTAGTPCTIRQACCDTFGVCKLLDPVCCNAGGGTPAAETACEGDGDGDILDAVCGDPCPKDPEDDADGDSLCADVDPCPSDPANDRDSDGLCADADPCPTDPANDEDADGLCAGSDPCPTDPENDVDGDGLCANVDVCPRLNPNDRDRDGIPDCSIPNIVPVASAWGTVVLALLLLSIARIRRL